MSTSSIRISIPLMVLIFPLIVSTAAAQMLAWDPPAESEVTGYRIYYGTSSGNYTENHEVGAVTECALADLALADKTTYFFTVRAFNSAGESSDSNEVSWTSGDNTPPAPPQGINVK